MKTCSICPNSCNIDGKGLCQQSPSYDNPDRIITTAVAIDPIEKKPLYNFLPGTHTLSIGTLGCNMKCLNCQNHEIAQPENSLLVPTRTFSPEELVDQALVNELPSISWTYNEPTIHPEWIIATAKKAQQYGIKTILVTNGYTSTHTLERLSEYVDAVNVDIKSMSDKFYQDVCQARLEPVLESVKFYVKNNIHTEVTNLIIPGYNDSKSIIKKLIEFCVKTSDKMPLHFTRFYPQFKLTNVDPTDVKTILNACDLAAYMKVKYVYPGNIGSSIKSNTYCKNCRHLLIERKNYNITNYITEKGSCPNCNHKVDVVI